MARSLWKGAISYGLVHIPVELYSAANDKGLDLTMLDRRDFAPVGFKRYNKRSGEEVGWDNIVKGYEYADDEFVVLSDEDLKRANVKATQSIDILAFVEAGAVPPILYEQPYYLAPERGGDKVYALLRETLRQSGKSAIAIVAIRTKQHLCALAHVGDAIVLDTLRYHDEIRPTDDLKLPDSSLKEAGISPRELQMALSLVDGMTEAWRPEQYHDSYRDDILALVDKKIKAKQSKTITVAGPEKPREPAGNVVDLVALLRQSLGKKPPARARVRARARHDDEDDAAASAKPAKAPAKTSPAKKAAPRRKSA
ncbi:MAG TPA: Ku protein [Janthinobacterium sp.]|nr:Ku protein [Janthinobacterium sp.]